MAKQNKIAANLQQDYTPEEQAQARQNIGLAEVAHSGDYNDLINKPAQVTGQVQSDWAQTNETAVDFIKNKPTIVDPVNSDWNATSGLSEILNKPSIPTATSDLQNDSGFITAADIPAQVNADWNAVSGPAEILHKPAIPDNIFVALYNVTTWQEMEAAWNAGKAIILKGADFGSNIHPQMLMYDFNTAVGQSRKFMFAPTVVPRVAAYYKYYAVLDENDGWSKDSLSNTAPTKSGGVFQLSGDETVHNLVEHRGWLCNNVFNFDLRFFCSANACNIYLAYVDQAFHVDVVGMRRGIRNDLKAAIDSTTTVQDLVRDIDVSTRIVNTAQPLNSTNQRIEIATLGPQELVSYSYDVYWDLDLIFTQWGVTGSMSPCYHMHIEKFGDPDGGHNYLFGTLAGTDLY